MRFVNLHFKNDGSVVVVNINKIQVMFTEGNSTKIVLDTESFNVEEKLERILELMKA